jgi:hypothetical protein
LSYKIIREERTKFDGTYEKVNNSYGSFFRVNSRNGLLSLDEHRNFTQYMSILVAVEVDDLAYKETPHTECLVDFRFTQVRATVRPRFVGESVRYQDVCEDMPVSTVVYSFRSFDPSFDDSSLNLCYSVEPNEYFAQAVERGSNGDVVLRKKFSFELMQASGLGLNISAKLFYCDQPKMVLDTQAVLINIQQVNKYPPLLMSQVSLFVWLFVIIM